MIIRMNKNINIPEDKREAIINASINEFSKHEYKHAILENIANNANISKSLLLYHFKSKKNLYAYIYDYVCQYLESIVADSYFYKITYFLNLWSILFIKN